MAPKTIDVDPEGKLRMSVRTGFAISAGIAAAVWAYAALTAKIDGVASDVAAMKFEQRKMAVSLNATTSTVQQFIGYFQAKNGIGGPEIRVQRPIDEMPPPLP